MNNAKVSIVIPVYNGHDFLGEAIDSALAQTYKNVEVLVVNDGSDDQFKTEQLALSYGNKVNYFFKPNGGVASALNFSIDKMSGDYFSWLSHDDLYTRDKIEKEMEALSKIEEMVSVVYCDYSVFTDNPSKGIPILMPEISEEHFRYWITVENKLHGCTLLIPRVAFEKVGRFNESLRTTQDYDLWFRMAREFNFIHIPKVLVNARSHSNQDSLKMAQTVSAECDTLLSNFISELSHAEIICATAKSLAESYRGIATSMFNRGFNKAGFLAKKLCNQHTNKNKKIVVIEKIRFSIKRFLPLRIKHIIKKFIFTTAGKNKFNTLRTKFSKVYEENLFGGSVSRSGEGSNLVQTEIIRKDLPRMLKNLSLKTFLDAPCGDWYWMKEIDLGVEHYIGVDIVEKIIQKNNKNYGNATRIFFNADISRDPLPKMDLIFCRDCLVHLSFYDSIKIIENFKRSGSRYILMTTFLNRTGNSDLVGENSFWRPLNMQLAPFNFPKPLEVLNEKCTEENGQYADKSLGLWFLSDIKF